VTSDEQPRLQPLSSSQREALELATSSYQGTLSAEVEDYLSERGIQWDAAVTYRLGEVSEPQPGHNRFRGMLALPYLDKDRSPLTLRFRCTKAHNHRELHHGKYNSVHGDVVRMFNVGAIHRATERNEDICVTEGELDAIVLEQIGLHAVALPGATTWQYYHARMLAGFDRVWLFTDPDDEGEALQGRMLQAMRQARAVRLTLGDVGETFLQGGPDALLDLMKVK
jgi:hypothetical protein